MTIQTFADAHHIYIGPAEDYQPPACASCGAELDWKECETCAGDGGDFEMTEESAWTEEEWQVCDICDGHGGWWWCENPAHRH